MKYSRVFNAKEHKTYAFYENEVVHGYFTVDKERQDSGNYVYISRIFILGVKGKPDLKTQHTCKPFRYFRDAVNEAFTCVTSFSKTRRFEP
jgi:hypothetical protein